MKRKISLVFSILLVISILHIFAGCTSKGPVNVDQGIPIDFSGESDTALFKYRSFEDAVDEATDLIDATCLRINDHEGYKEYEFKVNERYRGEPVDTIIVKVGNTNDRKPGFIEDSDGGITAGKTTRNLKFEIGKEYYLVLLRYIDNLKETEDYSCIESIYIPVHDLTQSTMNGQNLLRYTELKKITKEAIIDIFKNSKAPDYQYAGDNYIRSDDMETILRECNAVIFAEVTRIEQMREVDFVYFRIIETLKGEVEGKNKAGEYISEWNTIMPKAVESDTYVSYFKNGDRIIIASLNSYNTGYVSLAQKHSFYEEKDYQRILALLESIENE